MRSWWRPYLRGLPWLRPRRYAWLRRRLRESPVLLRAPHWRIWLVSGLMRVDGVPVTLELTYLLPTGTEITVVTERAIQLPTFQSDLPQLVWNVATTRAGVGTILMREHAAGRIAEFEALRRAEHQAQLDWLASGHQGTGVLRVDGRDVPAIRLDRPEVTAIGADLGQIRVAVAGPATALQACELTFDPHASRRSTQA